MKNYHFQLLILITVQADSISDYLRRKGLKSEGIHGDISQSKRERVLSSFRSGRFDVLVVSLN